MLPARFTGTRRTNRVEFISYAAGQAAIALLAGRWVDYDFLEKCSEEVLKVAKGAKKGNIYAQKGREKRLSRSFRLSPSVLEIIRDRAARAGISQADYIIYCVHKVETLKGKNGYP